MPQHTPEERKKNKTRNTIHKRAKAAAEGAASRSQFRGITEVNRALGAIIDMIRRRSDEDKQR